MDLLMRTVDAEDFPVCLDIQRGFAAGAQPHITFGRNEPALGHYHRCDPAGGGISLGLRNADEQREAAVV